MSGDLLTIFSRVNAEIVKLQPHARCYVGQEHSAAAGSPPRVVWIPSDEQFANHDARQGAPPHNPRPLCRRVVTIECEIWGGKLDGAGKAITTATMAEHIDACEALLVQVLSAAQKVTWDWPLRATRGSWELGEGSLLKFGAQYRLTFETSITVPMPETVATVEHFPITPVIDP